MKSGKRHMIDERELPNQDKIRTLEEKETDEYLGILEADTIKQEEMKTKFQKNISGEVENYPRQNLIKGINTGGVPLVRYSGPFLKWTREEL